MLFYFIYRWHAKYHESLDIVKKKEKDITLLKEGLKDERQKLKAQKALYDQVLTIDLLI